MKLSEEKYLIKAFKILKKRNDIDLVATQVPILGRYSDLVYVKRKTIYSVEFKLSNWKKAFIQSKDHKFGADYCYICMPARSFKEEFLKSLSDNGIGLLLFCNDKNWPFKEILKAKKTKQTFTFVRENTINYCLNYSNI